MMAKKKKEIDGIDKEILRTLIRKHPLVTRQIAKSVRLSPTAVKLRLDNLKNKGIIKQSEIVCVRTFSKNILEQKIRIKSPLKIYWDLDMKED